MENLPPPQKNQSYSQQDNTARYVASEESQKNLWTDGFENWPISQGRAL